MRRRARLKAETMLLCQAGVKRLFDVFFIFQARQSEEEGGESKRNSKGKDERNKQCMNATIDTVQHRNYSIIF